MIMYRAGYMSADALSGIDKKHYPCSERSSKKKIVTVILQIHQFSMLFWNVLIICIINE